MAVPRFGGQRAMQTKMNLSLISCLPTASGCLFLYNAVTSVRRRFLGNNWIWGGGR
jgi:hypothetical protein